MPIFPKAYAPGDLYVTTAATPLLVSGCGPFARPIGTAIVGPSLGHLTAGVTMAEGAGYDPASARKNAADYKSAACTNRRNPPQEVGLVASQDQPEQRPLGTRSASRPRSQRIRVFLFMAATTVSASSQLIGIRKRT